MNCMIRLKMSTAAFLACCLIQNVAAQTADGGPAELAALVGMGTAAALVRGEHPGGLQSKNPRPFYAPQNSRVRTMTEELIRTLKPGFFVESLFVYHKPEARAWTEAERAALYNETLALSSLAGIQYYSASRDEMRTFYETSEVVSGPDGKTGLADPVYTGPQPELTVYARQKDLTFGNNIYRYTYYASSDSLIFVQENMTTMTYGIIPAIGKNNLRSMVAVFDAGEYLLLYVASMAKAASVPGMSSRVGSSFSNRAQAIVKWFFSRADRAFEKTGTGM